jgi:hypothetical protein
LMTAIVPTRGLGTFRAGDRRERYQGPNDVAVKADGEDEAITIEVAKCLLDLGSSINAANQTGDTALHIAAGLAANRVVQFLVEHGADLQAKNKNGQTPLGVANSAPARAYYFFVGPDERKSTAELLRKLGATE